MQNKITFIIQGMVQPYINRQIAGIKKFFPQARVIVSTCNDIPAEIIGADKIIQNEDPGCLYCFDGKTSVPNNINRQITSTLAGLKACETEYAFKLRSDFLLTGKDFLQYFTKFCVENPQYQVFSHKVLACCYVSRNPRSAIPYAFHPSDFAFFGKTADLLDLFDIPLMTEAEARWDKDNFYHNRYVPEQYLFVNFLKKHKEIGFRQYNDSSAKNIEESERYLAANLILLNFKQFNLHPMKDEFRIICPKNALNYASCYTSVEWQKLYRKYVDPKHRIPLWDGERFKINNAVRIFKFYKLATRILALPFRGRERRRQIRQKLLNRFLRIRP